GLSFIKTRVPLNLECDGNMPSSNESTPPGTYPLLNVLCSTSRMGRIFQALSKPARGSLLSPQ
ncbi:hypothetical protein PHYSODRAFT_532307, partial [Phytophthora sojae]